MLRPVEPDLLDDAGEILEGPLHAALDEPDDGVRIDGGVSTTAPP